jgi:hypothetical protein
MTRFVIFLAVPLLAGCNVHSKDSPKGDDKVSVKADESGNISFDVPFAKGQIKLPAGFMHEGEVDIDGVKLMPGSQVKGFNLDSHNDLTNVELAFTTPATPDQVRSYFLDQFKQKGVEATVSGDAVTGKSKDGKPFRIEIAPGPGGTQGKLVVEDHEKDH